jgi:hypothetical protein
MDEGRCLHSIQSQAKSIRCCLPWRHPLALPFYAVTLFISAFILFLVQPIVAKIILPKLGGTPQVWNTCMVFFQMVLLAGYAYTHNVCTRLTRRQQLIVHAILLATPLIVLLPLPFAFGESTINSDGTVSNPHSLWGFVPDLGSNPIPSTLWVLFCYVALPFFVVATSAPLLQKWFVYTGHPASRDPYFLYGASNLGSMLSLPVYLVVIEPYTRLLTQGWIYTFGYLGLIAFVLTCAAMVWNAKDPGVHPKPEPKPEPMPEPTAVPAAAAQTGITATAPHAGSPATAVKSGQPGGKQARGAKSAATAHPPVSVASDDMTFGRRLRWVLLAAIPSSLMLGITTHITTDLSPMPFFWLIPLELYLLSFILVFARWPWVWTETPHQYFVYAQPIFIWLMIMTDVWNLTSSPAFIPFAIFAHVMGFFMTTMVCHGELAKDRPSSRHLTEFYLWMSVGGMLGGMFNALIAPVIFPKLWEFPLAIFAAALVRPKMFDVGFLDNWIAGMTEGAPDQSAVAKPGHKGKPHAPAPRGAVTANESLVSTLDFVWPAVILVLTGLMAFGLARMISSMSDSFFPGAQRSRSEASVIFANIIIFGIPLALGCLGLARPMRIGLAVGAVLLVYQFYQSANDAGSIHTSRSYFGAISVKQSGAQFLWGGATQNLTYNQLIHGHINHGMNFAIPEAKERGNPAKDLSRLATTYYHRDGPVGRVMEKYNWFPGDANTFYADARLPASLIAAAAIDTSGLPLSTLVTAWSETPIATIGLGTGTMASYGRPYQHVHFYEIDNQIRRLSLPAPTRELGNWELYKNAKKAAGRDPYFNYLEQAIERGASVQVLMGDARLRMALPYQNHYTDKTDHGGGPENFYHMMVVDAFSSDAIPAHLLTKQAFEMYFKKLVPDGVLCVHTSNRFVDLPKVVAAVTSTLRWKDENGKEHPYVHLVGHDANDDHERGHFTSEWVMVARTADNIFKKGGDGAFNAAYETAMNAKLKRAPDPYWKREPINERFVWTDDYYNLLSVVRFR